MWCWDTDKAFSKTQCDLCVSLHHNSFPPTSPCCSREGLFSSTELISSLLRGNWKAGVTHVPQEHCEPVQRRVPSLARQRILGQIILTSMAEEPEEGDVGLPLFSPSTCDPFIQAGFSARKTDWQPAGPTPALSPFRCLWVNFCLPCWWCSSSSLQKRVCLHILQAYIRITASLPPSSYLRQGNSSIPLLYILICGTHARELQLQ